MSQKEVKTEYRKIKERWIKTRWWHSGFTNANSHLGVYNKGVEKAEGRDRTDIQNGWIKKIKKKEK